MTLGCLAPWFEVLTIRSGAQKLYEGEQGTWTYTNPPVQDIEPQRKHRRKQAYHAPRRFRRGVTLENVRQVRMPDVSLFGWIPYEKHFHPKPLGGNHRATFGQGKVHGNTAYHLHEFESDGQASSLFGHAFCKMFATGNKQARVDSVRCNSKDSRAWLRNLGGRSRSVRAALDLSNVRIFVSIDSDGKPVMGLDGDREFVVGVTPVGVKAMTERARFATPRFNTGGEIIPTGWRPFDTSGLWRDRFGPFVEYGVKFRIGSKGNLIGRRLVGANAPWVHVRVRYALFADPDRIVVTIVGSKIPSWECHVERGLYGEPVGATLANDCISISPTQLAAFLRSGKASPYDAPKASVKFVHAVRL